MTVLSSVGIFARGGAAAIGFRAAQAYALLNPDAFGPALRGGDRHSVATFFNPPFDYIVTCAQQAEAVPPARTFGEHIQDRMRRTQAAP